MQGLWQSFVPFFNRFRLEFIFLILASSVALISLILFLYENKSTGPVSNDPLLTKIMVDISGAVKNPKVYEISQGSRLNDLIELAGGLTDGADRQYINQKFNLAEILKDQQKIYFPSYEDTAQENLSNPKALNHKIDINQASSAELDTLVGIGPTIADAIIKNRPYLSIEDLLNKKIVKKNVFENIKNSITVE